MSAVATPAPIARSDRCGASCAASGRSRGCSGPTGLMFAGGVVTNLMVHVCTFGAAVAGAVLIGEALDGSPSSELWPLVWVDRRPGRSRSRCSAGSRWSSCT